MHIELLGRPVSFFEDLLTEQLEESLPLYEEIQRDCEAHQLCGASLTLPSRTAWVLLGLQVQATILL